MIILNEKNDFEYSAKLPRQVMRIVGLALDAYRTENQRKGWRKLLESTMFWSSYCLLFVSVLGEVVYMQQSFGDFTSFLEMTALAPCIGFCTLSLTKMFTISMNSTKLSQIYAELREMYPKDSSDECVKTNMKSARRSILQFVILNTILIWCFNLVPLPVMLDQYLRGEEVRKAFPYLIWYPFDAFVMPRYAVLYVLQVWAGLVAAFGILCCDCLFCLYTSHVCMHFRLLARNLETLTPQSGKQGLEFGDLRGCIELHNKLIDFSLIIEQIFSPSILVNFIGSSLIICLVGFQITAGVATEDLIKYVLFLASSLVQVHMLCSYGNLLIDTSGNISMATYNCQWADASVRFKRSLQFMMLRSQQPQTLTAMKFSKVSLSSFGSILSTSYSYFTLLRTVYSTD